MGVNEKALRVFFPFFPLFLDTLGWILRFNFFLGYYSSFLILGIGDFPY